MTINKMEKAKEINTSIKFLEDQIKKIALIDVTNSIEIISNSRSLILPLEIKEIIMLMCKATYEKKLKEKEKEFEEL